MNDLSPDDRASDGPARDDGGRDDGGRDVGGRDVGGRDDGAGPGSADAGADSAGRGADVLGPGGMSLEGLTPEEAAVLDDIVHPSSLEVPPDLDGAVAPAGPASGADPSGADPSGADPSGGDPSGGIPSGDDQSGTSPIDGTHPVGEPAPDPDDLSAVAPPPDEMATEVLPDIGLSDGTVPWRALMAEAAAMLEAGGIAGAAVDARRIVEEATGLDGAELVVALDDPATVNGVAALDRMVERRLAGEPLQYVLGRWGFRTLDLMVDPRVLIPRPETEGVVDHVLAELDRVRAARAPSPGVVVDLGCGSGAIALSVAQERSGTEVHAVDRSPGAVSVTRANLTGLGIAGATVHVHEGSWFAPLPGELVGRVSVVASNPPYVAADDPLPPEVADWEPADALVPGPTGLEAVEVILAEAPRWLVDGGAVVIEIGETQGDAVRALAEAAGFVDVEIRADLAGRDRALVARWPEA